MVATADRAVLIERVDEALQLARAPTADLFSKVIQSACVRLPTLKKSGLAGRLGRLIEAGAWAEAAIALVELEMPAWWVRRLACEGGEWVCALSQQPNIPIALDDTAEAEHEILALAILRAAVEVRRRSGVAAKIGVAALQIAPSSQGAICCDSFA
jgi:hypothetical protein